MSLATKPPSYMTQAVLQTKLFTPPLRSGMILRRRLTQRLDEGLRLGRRLSLVSAPAGYGKTSLVAEWIQQARLPTAWLSLDPGDNAPARFWVHFLSALRSIPLLGQAEVGEEILSLLQSPQLPEIEFLLTCLINDICDLETADHPSQGVLLVLDDLHLITEPGIHAGIWFLVEHLPAAPQALHLVVVTRSDPPWPLARLRARADLTELRAQDLRFNREEVQAYLARTVGLQLSAENIAALERRTEGWISGLQMTALSLQRIHQARGEAGVAAFIRSFAGSQRFVLDYLVEEVLNQQLPQIQEFLLKTSILDRMCAPLCEAVLEIRDSKFESSQTPLIVNESFLSRLETPRSTLDYLERSNLFLFPLDEAGHWFRYHPLFSDLLRLRLEQELKDEIPHLHRKASTWYARAGLIAEAVKHSLAAGDHQQVARLVAGNTLALLYSGELPMISRWLGVVPVENPWLQIARAWIAAYTGDLQGSEAILLATERLLEDQSKDNYLIPSVEREHIVGQIAVIRAYRSFLSRNFTTAIAQIDSALNYLPVSDLLTRTFAVQVQAAALYEYGEPERAVEILEEHNRAFPESVDLRVRIMALVELPAHQFQTGRLHSAYDTSQRLLELINELSTESGEVPPFAAFAYTRTSRILYEWNDLDKAEQDALKSLAISQRWGQKDCQALANEILARTLQALGKPEEALRTVQAAKRLADQNLPLYQRLMKAREADMYLMQGNLAAAVRWADASDLTCEDQPLFNRREEYLVFCRVRIAQGRPAEVKELLGRLVGLAEAAGARPLLLQALALQACQAYDQGDLELSLHLLEHALALAEAEGYIRTFLDLGVPLLHLLQIASPQIQRDRPQTAYARRLLDAFLSSTIHIQKDIHLSDQTFQPSFAGRESALQVDSPAGERATFQPFNLLEPLSERELEILRLLNTTLTSAEIAENLVVAVSTVRTHIRNIYGKLGVNRRLEALERARELGLL